MAQRAVLHARTLPYWDDSSSLPVCGKLSRDIDVDVVVVGGGVVGLTTAYLLATAGRSVAVLERGRCAQVDTGHTSAHLTMVTDVRLTDMAKRFGRPHAQAVWDAGLAAIDQIDTNIREHEIDCGFEWVDGYLHAPGGRGERSDADAFAEEALLASELGFDAAAVHDVPFIGGPGIRFQNQARFHPAKYLAGLMKVIRSQGGAIYENSSADEFYEKPLAVRSSGHFARCKDIVIATHNPLMGLSAAASATVFQTKLALYTSYVVAGHTARGAVPDSLFWDTATAYEYLRVEPHRSHDLVILGGEDHKTGQAADTNACYEQLERKLTALVPDVSISHRWSGQVIETPDGLPYIGPTADHQYAATGFAGNGLTFGTAAAMIISDAILGRKNPWAELFDTDRTVLRHGLWDYLKENTSYPYYKIRDRFAGAESRSLRTVKRGHGQIVDRNGTMVAAYRAPNGALAVRAATCTHMGCVVVWNDAERTWDCPCHGSRFETTGEVVSGPAESPLPDAK
jgi:glycine/D-amino acid oxidase-like deaminating enzyme/nitrite reductase/ring-hydroxylating ferredoxin subunit